MSAHLYAVILAGGSGTRFWPLSRHLYPKQLLRIMGDDTLIQQTMRRVLGCVEPDRVLISTNPAQAESIRVQLGEWKDRLEGNFVIEPEGRNTAPAIGLAALEVTRRDPDGVMVILPADHVVKGEPRFQAAVRLGARLAEAGHLVTFGIKPIRPETGYGYIQPKRVPRLGKEARLAGYPVARFIEKPDAKTAARYLKAGTFYWNSGMFVWKAATILEEIDKHQPALGRGLGRIKQLLDAGATRTDIDGLYRELPSVSIDTGVMERSAHAAMIPVDFRWSDVGNWSSIEEVAPRDKSGNVINGKVVDLDSRRSIIYADRRLVATIGLSDMVVVDTPDATLVCPKERSQDVKKVVEILRKQKAPEQLEHLTVYRPWGSYTILEEGPGYKVKRVTVNPGGRLSLQMHHQRSEHWAVALGAGATVGHWFGPVLVSVDGALLVPPVRRRYFFADGAETTTLHEEPWLFGATGMRLGTEF